MLINPDVRAMAKIKKFEDTMGRVTMATFLWLSLKHPKLINEFNEDVASGEFARMVKDEQKRKEEAERAQKR